MKTKKKKDVYILNTRTGTVHQKDVAGRSFESCNLDAIPKEFRKAIEPVFIRGRVGGREARHGDRLVKLCKRCFGK